MACKKLGSILSMGVAAVLLGACASQPAATPAREPVPPPVANTPSAATAEAATASAMEKRFQDAARSYKVVQKDGKTMYCKREKRIGTTIPTMNCVTEAQLRHQVETMEEYRQRARNAARCTHGAGCGAGG